MCLRQIRLETHRLAKSLFRPREVILLLEGSAKVVERFGIARLRVDERPELGDRRLQIAFLHQRGAEVVPRGAVAGRTLDQGFERGHGANYLLAFTRSAI